MKTNKQNPDFPHLGKKLLKWYDFHGRDLPFRNTQTPYNIWISEIIFQQTRIDQGLSYYTKFIHRFPTISDLAVAPQDEVLLYWKGLGYYSRALNLHKTAKIIHGDRNGIFPTAYQDLLKLPGIGKYTAAAIVSICYGVAMPAVDGNFYRVFSRLFADDFDVSNASAFQYYSDLALRVMPKTNPGEFNQAIMDLGSSVCKPKNPDCEKCPFVDDCLAFQLGKVQEFPYKSKKQKVSEQSMDYYFITFQDRFFIQQRDDLGIWKKLFELPQTLPDRLSECIVSTSTVEHKLSHRKLKINFHHVVVEDEKDFISIAKSNSNICINPLQLQRYAFPKPIDNYLKTRAFSSSIPLNSL